MVEDFFPGMVVSGRMAAYEPDGVTFALLNTPDVGSNYPTGSGEMLFTDGTMVGKAAPDWVTRIFPGLNITRYDFARMYNWYIKHPDGRTHNNMIFRGTWNIYMEGDSWPDGRIKYDVGVDLLARYESKFWSSLGQGRIPLFSVSGRIVNGKITDHEVHYVPLGLVSGLLIKNNPLRAAYYAIKQTFESPQQEREPKRQGPKNAPATQPAVIEQSIDASADDLHRPGNSADVARPTDAASALQAPLPPPNTKRPTR